MGTKDKNKKETVLQPEPTQKHKDEQLSELGFLPKENVDSKIPTESNTLNRILNESGKIGWAILWLMGVPLPILFVLYLLRGCT